MTLSLGGAAPRLRPPLGYLRHNERRKSGWRRALAGALLAAMAAGAAAEPRLIGSYVWTDPLPHFGGFSAIEVTQDGRHLLCAVRPCPAGAGNLAA